MKINTARHDVTADGMMNQRKFTVDAGAHIMAVLSGLYKNPVDAMVREYLTNMYDAYVALKRTQPDAVVRPPVLHVPTALDGNLTFRDYGVGMSLDTVWNVYATYGASTKNGSNEEVGGFGLGSKTAFCYNGGASWTIESCFEGMKHVFMAFIGEDGVPNLSHVSSTPTEAHSGVAISIPIRRQDHRAVADAARVYVPYFPMPITVEGITVPPLVPIVQGPTWSILEYAGSRYDVRSRVIMGNVPYVIDWNEVSLMDDYAIREFFNRNSMDFHVNIGAVDIVPSRDNMKYTDRTKKAITQAMKLLLKELGGQIGKTLDACDTEWTALSLYRSMTKIERLHEVVKSISWRGREIHTAGITRSLEDLQKLDPSATVTRYAIEDSGRATINVSDSPAVLVVSPLDNTFVIIDDMPKGGALMARALVHQRLVNKSGAGRSYRYGHTVGHALLIKTKLSPAGLAALFGGMPEDRITTVSALKGIVPVPSNLKMSKDTIYRWSGTSWDARVNVPAGTTMYYLPLTKEPHQARFTFVSNRYGSQKDSVRLITNAATDLGIEVGQVYGIKATDVAKFPANWVNLVTAMETAMTQQMTANARMFARAATSVPVSARSLYQTIVAAKLNPSVPDMDEFCKAYQAVETAGLETLVRTYQSLVTRIPTLATFHDTVIATESIPDLKKLTTALETKYPMVSLLAMMSANNYYSRGELLTNNAARVLAYVKSIS